MIQINAQNIAAISSLLTEFDTKLKMMARLSHEVSSKTLPELEHDRLNIATIQALLDISLDIAGKLNLVGTRKLSELIKSDLNKVLIINLHNDLNRLQHMFESELNDEWVMHIPKNHAWWFNNKLSFGDAVINSFPSASQDILEAGNCYALERSTACVFHSMRILEFGLKALANDVNVIFDIQQWHTVIEKIEAEIKKMRQLPSGMLKNEKLQFLSEAAKEFMYFKDGWRNHVTHRSVIYDISQAYSALLHVRAFMQHISAQLKECDDESEKI